MYSEFCEAITGDTSSDLIAIFSTSGRFVGSSRVGGGRSVISRSLRGGERK
jgi:hypothetical protein